MRRSEFERSVLTGTHWPTPASRVREALRENGWMLLMAILFFVSLVGQTLTEFLE